MPWLDGCVALLSKTIRTEELREHLGIGCITNFVRRGRLGWFGHVERKANDDWVKACQTVNVTGNRGRGRGKKTWKQCVDEDLKEFKLNREDALNRDLWRTKVFGGHVLLAQARKGRR